MSFDLRTFATYEDALRGFEWDLPSVYNVAVDICDRHVGSGRRAARSVGVDGTDSATFDELAGASNRLASSLASLGLGRGDRIAMIFPHRIEALVAFLGIAKLGAVAVTLRWHDSPELYRHEFSVAQPDAVLYDAPLAELLEPLCAGKPFVGATADTWRAFQDGREAPSELLQLLRDGDDSFRAAETSIDDPLLVSFTSGSTGLSKGVVQAHRVGRGARPAFQMATDLGPQERDVFFSNLGWATMGGLRSIVLPAWQFGLPIVAFDLGDASIERQCAVLTEERVSVAYLMPALLKEIRTLGPRVHGYDWSSLRVVISSGEGVGAGLQDWLESELGAWLHPYYGQTELAVVISTCRSWFPSRAGSIGRLVPGHEVVLEDDAGEAAERSVGTVVVPADDPGLFLGYQRAEDDELPTGLSDPYVTEDVVRVDEDGYFFYAGRQGDVIELRDGRIVAAAELEDAAAGIAGVHDVSAIQVPATDGGAPALVLCVVVDGTATEADRLVADVRERVAASLPEAARPQEIVVTTSLPRTRLTNKVNRKVLREALAGGTVSDVLVRVPFDRGGRRR